MRLQDLNDSHGKSLRARKVGVTSARERLVERTQAHRTNPLRVNGRSVTRDTCLRPDLAIDSHAPYGARIPVAFDRDSYSS